MKKIGIIAFLVIFGFNGYGQVELEEGGKPSFLDRVYFGGSVNAQFGDYTVIYLSPMAGYMITRSLSGGVGITYQYVKNNFINYESNTYGGRLFLRQNIKFLKLPLFAYSEYESLNIERYNFNNELQREWYPRLFIGGGLFQPIGRRGGFYILVMYDVIDKGSNSYYSSPWEYRIGFSF